jgi:hypothetical protein
MQGVAPSLRVELKPFCQGEAGAIGLSRMPMAPSKTHSMLAHDSLGPEDGNGFKNARTATIEPNEQGTIGPTQMHSTPRALAAKH